MLAPNPDACTSLSSAASLSVVPIADARCREENAIPSHVTATQRCGEGELGQMPHWTSESCPFEESAQGPRDINLEERCFDTNAETYGRTLDTVENGDDLRNFLEDMKRTIQTWSARHSLLVQGTNISTTECADMDGVEATRTDCNIPVTGQVENRSTGSSFPCLEDQDNAMQASALNDHREEEPSKMLQSDQLEERGNSSHAGEVFFPLHEIAEELAPQHAQEPPTQEMTEQEPLKEEENVDSPSAMHLEVDQSQADLGKMYVQMTSSNGNGEVENFVTPTADQRKMKIESADLLSKNLLPAMQAQADNDDLRHEAKTQPHLPKIEVVSSPDWLPKGWLTEMKTRCNGHSAGSRDKYYFDPVSKRRFRSQKEVYSFLETGKLGRYKSRPKLKPVKKLLAIEHPSSGQVNDLCQERTSNGSGTATSSTAPLNLPSISGSSTVPSVTAPMGLLSNVFMPHRPGQPSEWLVYESLASLPHPVFERFRYTECNLSKSNGSSSFPTPPWFPNNAEGTWRQFFDKSNLGKSVERIKDGQGLQFLGEETRVSEVAPKHSASAAKKSSASRTKKFPKERST